MEVQFARKNLHAPGGYVFFVTLKHPKHGA
jgi:hypothetical protein